MEAERGSSGWSAGARLLARYEDDGCYWHERLVVLDHLHAAWRPEALEREGPRCDRVPARVSESGDFLASFGEPIGRVAFDALAIDEEALQECDAHPERAPAEAPERIRNWNRSLRNAWPCGSRCRPFAADGGLTKENVDLTRREALDANWEGRASGVGSERARSRPGIADGRHCPRRGRADHRGRKSRLVREEVRPE